MQVSELGSCPSVTRQGGDKKQMQLFKAVHSGVLETEGAF